MGTLPRDMPVRLNTFDRKPSVNDRLVLADQTNRQLNHSPIDSPPAVKKKLCRLPQVAATSSHQGALDNLDAEFVFDAPAVEIAEIALGGVPKRLQDHKLIKEKKKTKTILKKKEDYHCAIPSSPQRNVHFRDSVTVFRMDEDGAYLCTECQALQVQPVSLSSRRASQRRATLCNSLSVSSPDQSFPSNCHDSLELWSVSTRPPPTPHPNPTPLQPANAISSTKSHSTSVNFTFVEDNSHGLRLRFQVPLGTGYGPDDVVVKANMSGNRIRVVANKTSPSSQTTYAPYNERFPLPMDVDPFKVTARLDARGQLIVEAPVLTLGRKSQLMSSK